jgi:hypothetical protein
MEFYGSIFTEELIFVLIFDEFQRENYPAHLKLSNLLENQKIEVIPIGLLDIRQINVLCYLLLFFQPTDSNFAVLFMS